MSSQNIDSAGAVRPGEELDAGKLVRYLQGQVEGFSSFIEVRQFPGGFSNLTYLISTDDKEYVLRRPPFGANIKSAHDMAREYRVLRALQPVYSKIPQPLVYCQDQSIIGAEFYMMERVKGLILRNKPPKGLDLTPDLMRSISEKTIDNLVDLHSLDLSENGLLELGKPEGYNQRQIEGWIKRYQNAQTDDIKSMNEIADYLSASIPTDESPAFIHNDYKYDNIVLDANQPDNILAVLDWEMSTVGNPLMDLATSLAYWAEGTDSPALKPFNLTWLPGNLNRAEVLDRYAEKTGREIHHMVYYFAFASFKLGTIVQQIYARYKKGLTKDPRFAMLIEVVKACGQNGVKAIDKDRISNLN